MVDCLNCRYMEVYQTIQKSGRHKIYGKKEFLCTNRKSKYVMLFREEGDICDEWKHKNFLIRFLDKHFGER